MNAPEAGAAAPPRRRSKHRRRPFANCLLALASVVVALALCELAARTLLTRYDRLADPPRRHYSSAVGFPHPDTGVRHRVAYNNLGGRQHRNFADAELRAGLNIAFFGDSFTENLRMAAPYSFTEPLDHLLNALRGDTERGGTEKRGPTRINVLNFGMTNTGPGDQYLLYRRTPHRQLFEQVWYVHCDNDFENLKRGGQWALNAHGDLVAQARGDKAAWVRLSSGLHLSYLGLDAWHRLAGDAPVAPQQESDAVFRAVVLRWQREVEANGSSFHVALVPRPGARERFAAVGWPESLEVLDLAACFNELAPGGSWRNDWRFANDSHWNEAGNMLAARCLLRAIAPQLAFPAIDADVLQQETAAFYQAFAADDRWPGERWAPAQGARPRPSAVGEAEAIVSRYLAFGNTVAADGAGGADEAAPTAMSEARQTPARRVGGGWRVHVDAVERLLVYVKDPCPETAPASGLFAHAYPAHAEDLDPDYHARAFAELGTGARTVFRAGEECAVAMTLPRFPVARLVTGEQHGDGPVLWREEFPLEAPETVADYRREYQRIAAAEPTVRARWNVYAGDGEVAYLKTPCGVRDLRREFFLRLLPAAAASPHLARVTEEGFVPWIYQHHRSLERAVTAAPIRRWYENHFIALFDNRCLIKAWLPKWRTTTVWTGQITGLTNLWEAKFHLDTKRFEYAFRQARDGRPSVRGWFDVYWTRTREAQRAVTYIREPCSDEDVRARFFLHQITAAGHRPAGNDDMDFDFDSRGAMTDGRCVVVAPVPSGVLRVRTGQFNATGPLWEAEL